MKNIITFLMVVVIAVAISVIYVRADELGGSYLTKCVPYSGYGGQTGGGYGGGTGSGVSGSDCDTGTGGQNGHG
jgi:hypothetical protein